MAPCTGHVGELVGTMRKQLGNAITIRFALPSAELSPYVTTYYFTQVSASPNEPVLEDYLHPEWANLRFMEEGWSQSAIGDAPLAVSPGFSATGPTSKATRFRVGSGRSWGIGLMPLGWASLIEAPASDYADKVTDGNADPVFKAFQPLARKLAQSSGDFADELELIESHMARDHTVLGAEKYQADRISRMEPVRNRADPVERSSKARRNAVAVAHAVRGVDRDDHAGSILANSRGQEVRFVYKGLRESES